MIPANLIEQIISINPHQVDDEDHYFMFEQLGNNITNLGGFWVSCKDDKNIDGQVDEDDNADSNGYNSGDL